MIGCSGFKIENEIEFEDIICTDSCTVLLIQILNLKTGVKC